MRAEHLGAETEPQSGAPEPTPGSRQRPPPGPAWGRGEGDPQRSSGPAAHSQEETRAPARPRVQSVRILLRVSRPRLASRWRASSAPLRCSSRTAGPRSGWSDPEARSLLDLPAPRPCTPATDAPRLGPETVLRREAEPRRQEDPGEWLFEFPKSEFVYFLARPEALSSRVSARLRRLPRSAEIVP